MLTTADLTQMREVAATALPGTAVIQTSTFTSDGGGGGTTAWTASGTLACRIAPMGGNEHVTGDRITAYADFIVTLPFDADVDTDVRLLIDGETYNAEAVRSRSWGLTTRVEVNKATD